MTLRDGEKPPEVNAALGSNQKFVVGDMPVVEGLVEGEKATGLRCTRCDTVVVRTDLMPKKNYTGSSSPVFLLDRTVRHLSEAEGLLRTQFFTGRESAKRVDITFSLIFGNLLGVRPADKPDSDRDEDSSTPPEKNRRYLL